MRKSPPTPEAARRKARERARLQALRALRRAKAAAAAAGVDLTEWEDAFLGSVEARVRTYGRAFADPEKGGAGSALSVLQRRALRQISAKTRPEEERLDGPLVGEDPQPSEKALTAGRSWKARPGRSGESLKTAKPLGRSGLGRASRRRPPPAPSDP